MWDPLKNPREPAIPFLKLLPRTSCRRALSNAQSTMDRIFLFPTEFTHGSPNLQWGVSKDKMTTNLAIDPSGFYSPFMNQGKPSLYKNRIRAHIKQWRDTPF